MRRCYGDQVPIKPLERGGWTSGRISILYDAQIADKITHLPFSKPQVLRKLSF